MVKTTSEILKRIAPAPRQCRSCPAIFTPFSATALNDEWLNLCPDCSHRVAVSDGQKIIAECAAKEAAKTPRDIRPAEFRDTVPHKLPSPTKLREVLGWKFCPVGLLLSGPTRRGKSRCAWELAKREHEAGRVVRALNTKSGFDYAGKYGQSPDSAREWVDRMISADILILDDTFKVKLTESFECALFAVVCLRLEDRKPIITTTNDTPVTLKSRMTIDRGGPMVARLQEYSTRIEF